jgi:hypothetical protein
MRGAVEGVAVCEQVIERLLQAREHRQELRQAIFLDDARGRDDRALQAFGCDCGVLHRKFIQVLLLISNRILFPGRS